MFLHIRLTLKDQLYIIYTYFMHKWYCTLTKPSIIAGESSCSPSMYSRDFLATDSKASSGQALNQSMVQLLTSPGNCLSRDLNTSPMGLMIKRYDVTYTFFLINCFANINLMLDATVISSININEELME